jgi:gamma-butyrobetaine dioxygenase
VDAVALTDHILDLLLAAGGESYFGEPVSQLEHALQTASLAVRGGAVDTLVVAALLHDIGHVLHGEPEHVADEGVDTRHENAGDQWLRAGFGPSVTEPIRLHVAAKRYLCAIDPEYAMSLSAASQLSLALQGGPMSAEEITDFLRSPWWPDAVALRRWDDAAKIPGLKVPDLSSYRSRIERVAEGRSSS